MDDLQRLAAVGGGGGGGIEMTSTNNNNSTDNYSPYHDSSDTKPRQWWAVEHDPSAGPEVLPHSNLEVAAPPRPDLSHTKTWEKQHSDLPELTTTTVGAGWYPNSPPTYHNNYYHQHHGPPPPPPEGGGGTICGLKNSISRAVFLAIAVFLAVVGVAVGVGVGVAMQQQHKSDPSPSPPAPANTTTSPALPAPTAQGTTGGPEQTIQCPGNNLTLYTSGVTTQQKKQYVLLCGRDYNSAGGSVDLYNQPASTPGDCVDLCAEQQGCVGAGWGSYQGRYVCWLKSRLAAPNWAPGWYFFVAEDDDGTN